MLVPKFPLFPCVVIWCVVFNMVFIQFSDCFLCFTHVMGTLVQFILLLCHIVSYMFPGGVGTCFFNTPCPVFTVGNSRLVVVAVQGAPPIYLY
jgi:hypothetical protein